MTLIGFNSLLFRLNELLDNRKIIATFGVGRACVRFEFHNKESFITSRIFDGSDVEIEARFYGMNGDNVLLLDNKKLKQINICMENAGNEHTITITENEIKNGINHNDIKGDLKYIDIVLDDSELVIHVKRNEIKFSGKALRRKN